MAERRMSTNNATTKQFVYCTRPRLRSAGGGQVTKGEGDRVGATSKYCGKAAEGDEDVIEADEEEEGGKRRRKTTAVVSPPARHFPHRYRFFRRIDIIPLRPTR